MVNCATPSPFSATDSVPTPNTLHRPQFDANQLFLLNKNQGASINGASPKSTLYCVAFPIKRSNDLLTELGLFCSIAFHVQHLRLDSTTRNSGIQTRSSLVIELYDYHLPTCRLRHHRRRS